MRKICLDEESSYGNRSTSHTPSEATCVHKGKPGISVLITRQGDKVALENRITRELAMPFAIA